MQPHFSLFNFGEPLTLLLTGVEYCLYVHDSYIVIVCPKIYLQFEAFSQDSLLRDMFYQLSMSPI